MEYGKWRKMLNRGYCNKGNTKPRYVAGVYRCDQKKGHVGAHSQNVIGGKVVYI